MNKPQLQSIIKRIHEIKALVQSDMDSADYTIEALNELYRVVENKLKDILWEEYKESVK